MKHLCKLLVLTLVISLMVCGCGKPQEPELDYESMVVAPVDLAITDCITEQQITSVVGHPMQLLGVYEDGVQAIWQSDDGSCQVTIHMMNQTREVFDSQVADAEVPMTLQEGLGEAAFWYEGRTEMMLYYNGYALDVAVVCSDTPLTEPHVRQIAELMLAALQPQE
ncbi:MAG: hypothetical protein IJO42_02490 [Clostridia bacterium]|nr:hypothetical protein [Clostridia bacterium]